MKTAACQIWGCCVRSEGRPGGGGGCWPVNCLAECQPACLVIDVASMFSLIQPHPSSIPAPPALGLKPCQTCLLLKPSSLFLLDLYFPSLCTFSALFSSPSNSLFSPFISLWSGYLQWRWKWSVNLSSHQSPPSPEVLQSLPASQNDDWHFYLFVRNKCGG